MMDRTEGWAQPDHERTFHYFVAQESLCRKWGYGGVLSPVPYVAAGWNCKACWERARALVGAHSPWLLPQLGG